MATIIGTDSNNILNGTASSDTIIGRAGHDQLFGNRGNDRLQGGTQNDLLNGGLGINTADYSNILIGGTTHIGATAGVIVNLNLAGAQNTGGGAGVDQLVSMENLTGSNFNDTLTGNSANNMLTGLAGNDTLNGGNGNDTLQGDIGNDLLNGGDGIDTASYRTATAGVTVVLGEEGAQNIGGAGFDTLIDIETITGSNFNDALTLEFEGSNSFGVTTFNGGAGDDTLSDTRSPLVASEVIFNGGAGNDTLSASSGTLNGDEGNDSLSASETFATLNGGAGNDILGINGGSSLLNGGDGNDKLIASHSPSAGSHGSPTLIGGAGTDHLFHFDEDDPGGQVTLDYNAVSDSPAGTGRDKINGFDGDIGNTIDLTTIDANALVAGNQAFIFGGSFTAGHLKYAGGILSGNTDGDAAAEFEIQLLGAPALTVGGAGTDILL